jgi:hypothetical protein
MRCEMLIHGNKYHMTLLQESAKVQGHPAAVPALTCSNAPRRLQGTIFKTWAFLPTCGLKQCRTVTCSLRARTLQETESASSRRLQE